MGYLMSLVPDHIAIWLDPMLTSIGLVGGTFLLVKGFEK